MVYKPTYNWGAPSCTTLGKPSELHRSPFLEKDIQPHLLHLNSLVFIRVHELRLLGVVQ